MRNSTEQKALVDRKAHRKEIRRKITVWLASLVLLGGVLFIVGVLTGVIDTANENTAIGKINAEGNKLYNQNLPENVRHPRSVQVKSKHGDYTVSYPKAKNVTTSNLNAQEKLNRKVSNSGNSDSADNMMGTYVDPASGKELPYAPDLDQSFYNVKCNLTPDRKADPGSSNSWIIPSLSVASPTIISGKNTTTGVNTPWTIPDAPAGTQNADTQKVGSDKGSVLQLGHVNYPYRSARSGELSSYGMLHKIQPCAHVYERGDDGKVYEYVATSAYTILQTDFPNAKKYFRNTGSPMLYMVTCSGPTIKDDGTKNPGGTLFTDYKYNEIVEWMPAK